MSGLALLACELRGKDASEAGHSFTLLSIPDFFLLFLSDTITACKSFQGSVKFEVDSVGISVFSAIGLVPYSTQL